MTALGVIFLATVIPRTEVIDFEQAKGVLRREYEAALKRAGRIWHVVSIVSQNPRVMKSSMVFYSAIMFGKYPLTDAEFAKDHGLVDEAATDEFVHQMAIDWRQAMLGPENQALCDLAEELSHQPNKVNDRDIQVLRRLGFDDQTIHDAVQVVSYFNYINRNADGLGIEYEDFTRSWGMTR